MIQKQTDLNEVFKWAIDNSVLDIAKAALKRGGGY